MAPKITRSRKITRAKVFRDHEQSSKAPSILAFTGDAGQNYLDADGGWGEEEDTRPGVPRSRISRAAAKPSKLRTGWYSSLSSGLNGARTKLTPSLHLRESARGAVSQLRRTTMRGPKSRVQSLRKTMPNLRRSGRSQSRRAQPVVTVTESESDDSFDFMYTEVDLGDEPKKATTYGSRLSKLLPKRPQLSMNRKQVY